ncbi:MAG: VWA domain-containing protein [Bacteroidetes bacterium]|nr:VWA domain-containing protein [Bacteroidota bacterium]
MSVKRATSKNKFRIFANAVALTLAEVAFWGVLIATWYSIQQIAPNVQLERPTWTYVLLILPASLVIFLFSLSRKKRWAETISDESLWPSILPFWRPQLHGWRFFLWRLAMASIIIGMLDLKVGAKLKEVESEGVDVMIALDVSKSMDAEDTGASRLKLAKQSIQRFLNELGGDRVGLVVFAGEAYVQCPITTDYGAFKLFLDGVTTELVPVQGTAVGRAIEVCAEGFDPESNASKMVVVFTDGENHEDDAAAVAQRVLEKGIEVHTIGMGTTSGAPIPLYDRYGRTKGFKSDQEGNPIVTALDEASLIQIAEAGNGSYTQAGISIVNISGLLSAINNMEQTELSTVAYTEYDHLFHWFFVFAIILVMIESFLHWSPKSKIA